MYDLIIIGGGAAGLFAGARAAESGLSFCILEKMNQCGMKLLVSGSGQCNLSHAGDIRDFPARYGKAARFVKPALFELNNRTLVSWLEDRGLPCFDRGDGKIFPRCLDSREVRDLLQRLCRDGRIFWKQKVLSVTAEDGFFTVQTGTKSFQGCRLLICCGGASYPSTGSEGDGYQLARDFGHTVTGPLPALTPVYINPFPLASCAGISLPVAVELFRQGRKLDRFEGDILITHKGFSGPVILNNSREMAEEDELRISWLPGMERATVEEELQQRRKNSGKKTLKGGLAFSGIPEALLRSLIALSGLKEESLMAQLSKVGRRSFLDRLCSCPFRINGLGGFQTAMVTAGGVDRKEVNPRTMESRLVPGLFFAGEVLDVDGETGGYNLQFAFSSAALAVKSVSADG